MTGAVSYHAGLAAEDAVARLYEAAGCLLAARRWRGKAGEIDMIARDGAKVIFVEVKQSRTHAEAASHLSPRQFARICLAAEEFVGSEPQGSLTEMRFDVALVDGMGVIEILENAYAA
jgi:putative endonuclease